LKTKDYVNNKKETRMKQNLVITKWIAVIAIYDEPRITHYYMVEYAIQIVEHMIHFCKNVLSRESR